MAGERRAGDAVVVIAHGPGEVVSADGERVVVRLREGEVTIRAADAGELLRDVVDRAVATKMLARLCERIAEERTLPRLRSIREIARAPLERQVEYVRWYFRGKKEVHPSEKDILLAASENVLAELAMALGVADDDLRVAVRKGTPSVGGRTNRTLPDAPALDGADHVRSFWLGSTAIVGEWPTQDRVDCIVVKAKPGAWHAYVADERLVLVHAAPSSVDASVDAGGVNVEGGMIGVLDEAALVDPEFGPDEADRLRREGEGYGERGVEVATLGDGDHRVLVDDLGGATRIVVPF